MISYDNSERFWNLLFFRSCRNNRHRPLENEQTRDDVFRRICRGNAFRKSYNEPPEGSRK